MPDGLGAPVPGSSHLGRLSASQKLTAGAESRPRVASCGLPW